MDIADANNIKIQWLNMSSSESVPQARVLHRTVIMNRKWRNKKEIPFQIAHEMSHILNDDSGILYYTTSANMTKAEGGANAKALEILSTYYFLDIPQETANVDDFMNEFQIPTYLRDMAIAVIKDFYLEE